ncbi:MAG: type III toxin-antitoxin system ToxN/AbiQ family toxin [Lachnospiraceae bacterium]|nr:type III toxin-antitoxin system ToxN/AbiQ family toxin [Lachnospiraceae bacterium]
MEKEKPVLYYVDKEYLKYLHKEDYRVSVKYNNRPFAGIVTSVEGRKYMIPLTSQTTEERKKEGKNKRSALVTTFITETSGKEISNLLYNNMIPVTDEIITALSINPETDTYESNEIRYLRKNWESIEEKATNVFHQRYNEKSPNFGFLKKTCCDFKKLETALDQYGIANNGKRGH